MMRRDESGQKTMKPCDPKEFHLILDELLEDARVGEMKRFTQHGSISTFDHCRNVASLSQRINRRLHLRADEEALLKGAMLHDYFLSHVAAEYHPDPPQPRSLDRMLRR